MALYNLWHLTHFVLIINSILTFSPQYFIVMLYDLWCLAHYMFWLLTILGNHKHSLMNQNLPYLGSLPPSLTLSLYFEYTTDLRCWCSKKNQYINKWINLNMSNSRAKYITYEIIIILTLKIGKVNFKKK